MNFSVLLSLYYKEQPLFLDKCLESVFNQTLPADEVVLVEDGPLTSELYSVVDKYKKVYPNLKIISLEKNCGLGMALNEGMKHCSNDLIIRADTDDINKPWRFEKQVEYMEGHPDIDVCGASIDEFVDDIDNIISIRYLPESHEDLYEFARKRNPINHPVSIFRKRAVEAAGGYRHFYLFEDYYLWVRMMMNGSRFHNITESLLFFRYTPQMIKRRGGWKYAFIEMNFQYTLYRINFITFPRMLLNISIRFTIRIMPNSIRKKIYNRFLRESNNNKNI